MFRYKCVVAYDGSNFSGYQVQPNGRTVQGELEAALKKIHKGEEVKVVGSGRTDAGVHATGQVIHFNTPLHIPLNRWPIVLNSMLPNDISIKQTELVDANFHARFSVVKKEYRYKVYTSPYRDPFKHVYAYHYPYPLNLDEMEKASKHFIGTHDFTSFCSAKTEVADKVRTIEDIRFVKSNEELEVQFIGNGFLYNMVRILMGTLLEVGIGKRKSEEIPSILEQRNRINAGKTAPAEGLYLWKVYYD
ncbi:tRNA pseudouridine(38-40) synthase TruA [Heyndrickxia sporothermodurans]|uniref:tRNA pseudouridine(38-40) synthase TruA n=1 Tax=Heyndrickxia sporothermodurans TaxID=46224 RepID=UPI0035E341B5